MDSYDFVIVGGGTAGCVLAARLSENPHVSVLLLEAGAAQSPAGAEVPPAWPALLQSPANWGDVAAGQTAARRPVAMARARVLGGGSAINAMVFVRGHRSSYDRWAKQGADGWGFDDLLPFFRLTETANGHDPALRGTDGPLIVGPANPPNPVLAACLDAAAEAGYRRADDISGGLEEGFGWTDLTITGGRRQSALDAYLRPAMQRGNLRVVTGALAHRLLMDQQMCTGVEYSADGEVVRVRADNEVVLTAGTVGTPKLLMLSGIGPAAALRPHGIEVVADLPGVGENLHDHPYAFVIFGGSSSVAARGYAECGRELLGQVPDLHTVVVAVGSGATMAGLVAAVGADRVLGVDTGAIPDPLAAVARFASEASGTLVDPAQLTVRRDQVGGGYGDYTPETAAALRLAARTEGLVLDPVYTARAVAGLAAAIRDGQVAAGRQTVFVHTGGLPGLFGHAAAVEQAQRGLEQFPLHT